ncbi:hypothetical protein [Cryptosporangium aurantiacum]|uniref:Uncharacterized protein n=1 Tax=Cryptosporangium aurantiacum TaxID=134849 RepID=A0A1M7QDA8_9ACTN|nr:hypothetical protein [Cryptosporangium aurantiacum]SHN28837.1 hypothetical protein SAMN05443668_104501 [Cryptosporangium aurantiacum]
MPTQIEERLTAALAARADQVTSTDLRPPAPPTGPRRPPHRGLYLGMALAAALSAIAVLVLIAQVRDAPIRPSEAPDGGITRLPATTSIDPSASPRKTVLGPPVVSSPHPTARTPEGPATTAPDEPITPGGNGSSPTVVPTLPRPSVTASPADPVLETPAPRPS